MDQESIKGDKTSDITKQPPDGVRCTTSQDTVASYAEMRMSKQPIEAIDAVWNSSSSSSSNNLMSNDVKYHINYSIG